MIIPFEGLSPNKVYFTMIQTLMPRPVAWVLSENPDQSLNLAPFSYFNAICSDPPLIMLSIGLKPDGSPKDTRLNIEAAKDFVIHIAHREMAATVTRTSATLPREVSEIEEAGLATCEFPGSRLPRLADCRIAYACTLHELREIGNASQALVIGEVKQVYIDDAVTETDAKGRMQVLAEKVDPIGRLGGGEYTTFGEKLNIPRPE
ncbi:MAG: flavin reductase (DIM6/NTAB) family NADH-FMN oxidoreductase RutF [Planctomycetota bacterium]|jgi:flavin reductase (DIM6/NTAB) family NADH-FMN oxidoreductase RutF